MLREKTKGFWVMRCWVVFILSMLFLLIEWAFFKGKQSKKNMILTKQFGGEGNLRQ